MFSGHNLIDLAILAVFALSVLMGLFRGSVTTGLNLIAIGLSLLIAKLCYPLVTEWIAGHDLWMEYLVYFSEGSSHIPTEMMEYARMDVSVLSAVDVQSVVSASGFTTPFREILLENINGQVYAGEFSTLFEYFDQTVADYSLNTISFVLTFFFTYAISSLLILLIDKTFNFPLLRIGDTLVGGALGLLRGYLLMMLLATMVPLVVNMLQINFITEMVEGSKLLAAYLPGNWFFGWIRSIL